MVSLNIGYLDPLGTICSYMEPLGSEELWGLGSFAEAVAKLAADEARPKGSKWHYSRYIDPKVGI